MYTSSSEVSIHKAMSHVQKACPHLTGVMIHLTSVMSHMTDAEFNMRPNSNLTSTSYEVHADKNVKMDLSSKPDFNSPGAPSLIPSVCQTSEIYPGRHQLQSTAT